MATGSTNACLETIWMGKRIVGGSCGPVPKCWKDMDSKQGGPFVYCLLDGVGLEAVEHLKLEDLAKENGDSAIWRALDSRFPDKLQHDQRSAFARCFNCWPHGSDRVSSRSSRLGVPIHHSALSEDQHAIVMVKSQGDFKNWIQ